MSNSTKQRNSRKQEHPRTLAFRRYFGDDMLECKLDDIYSYMTSENTSYFGDEPGEFPRNIGSYRFTFEYSDKIIVFGILKYGFEKEIDEYYNLHSNDDDHYKHSRCDCKHPLENFYDSGIITYNEEAPLRFFYLVANKNTENDSWRFDVHVHSSIQPIICHAMTQEEYDLYYRETNGICYDCQGEIGYMSGQCADCYWEEDSRRKHRRRAFYYFNPDLKSAWQAHCHHTFYPTEEIVVSDSLRAHIPKSIAIDSPEYNSYIEKFQLAIIDGMFSVMKLLKEINPDYSPKYNREMEQENQMH